MTTVFLTEARKLQEITVEIRGQRITPTCGATQKILLWNGSSVIFAQTHSKATAVWLFLFLSTQQSNHHAFVGLTYMYKAEV